MFKSAKIKDLEFRIFEMEGSGNEVFMSSEGPKAISLMCLGPIYDKNKKVGELKNFYLTKNTANLQHIILDKNYWNKGYLTNFCEYLIDTYINPNNIKTFIFEEIFTANEGTMYSNNLEKSKKIKEKLIAKNLVKSGELIYNEKSKHYDLIFQL